MTRALAIVSVFMCGAWGAGVGEGGEGVQRFVMLLLVHTSSATTCLVVC